jgi:hypothetical protein
VARDELRLTPPPYRRVARQTETRTCTHDSCSDTVRLTLLIHQEAMLDAA